MSVSRLRLFATLPVASAAVISFESVRHLAEIAGFGNLAWLFPLTLDAAVAFGTDLWIRRERSAAMNQARALALVGIVLSLAANVADHWISTRSVLAAVLGAIPPAILAAMLSVLHRHALGESKAGPPMVPESAVPERTELGPRNGADRGRFGRARSGWSDYAEPIGPTPEPADRSEITRLVSSPDRPARTAPKRTAAAARTIRPRTAGNTTSSPVPQDSQIVEWIRSESKSGPVTKRSVITRWSVGSGRALRLIKEATDGQED
jgi:hypothetical protein